MSDVRSLDDARLELVCRDRDKVGLARRPLSIVYLRLAGERGHRQHSEDLVKPLSSPAEPLADVEPAKFAATSWDRELDQQRLSPANPHPLPRPNH